MRLKPSRELIEVLKHQSFWSTGTMIELVFYNDRAYVGKGAPDTFELGRFGNLAPVRAPVVTFNTKSRLHNWL
jgi:hypothetical protein